MAGIDEALVHLGNAASVLTMGSTMVGVGWLCFAATRPASQVRKESATLKPAEKNALGLLGFGMVGVLYVAIANARAFPVGQARLSFASAWTEMLFFASLTALATGLVILGLRARTHGAGEEPRRSWRRAAEYALSITAGNFAAMIVVQLTATAPLPWWFFAIHPAAIMALTTPMIRYRHILRRPGGQTQ